MPSENDEVIALVLDPVLRVAGEDVCGEVHIDFRQLQRTPVEEVYVKLRGSIFARITKQHGNTDVSRQYGASLIRQDRSLWKKGSAYPSPQEHILKLPFRFALPHDLLPSFQYRGYHKSGSVAYSVEVIGVRTGLHFNKRIFRPISILPYNMIGAQLRDNLMVGWTGGERLHKCHKKVRRGIWGEYGGVALTVTLPNISELPIFTPIPITLHIATTSKPMRREDSQKNEPIFPSPPLSIANIELNLVLGVFLKAGNWIEYGTEEIASLGGFGTSANAPQSRGIAIPRVQVTEQSWIPELGLSEKSDEKKQKGVWKQEASYTSTFQITCPPTFDSAGIDIRYQLAVKVSFPGIGNDVRTVIPVQFVSSLRPPGSDTRWDGPPPELDLPPTYLSATDWEHDEKQDK